MEENRKNGETAAEAAELSTESQDKSRKRKKKAKAALSFVIMALLLLALFFASVNIGSLKEMPVKMRLLSLTSASHGF